MFRLRVGSDRVRVGSDRLGLGLGLAFDPLVECRSTGGRHSV